MAKHLKRKSKKLITDNKLHSKDDREEFGDDLLIEILLRLPVISLLLFKSVSKHWLSLITDPSFTLRRRQIRNIDPPSGLFIRGRELYFVPLDIRIPSNRSRVHTTVFNFGNNKILQPCNGLFLCASSERYYVYNPSTKVCKMLPQRHKSDLDQCCYVGGMRLAFDPTKSPHYKIVYFGCNFAASAVGVQTYSSETGNWSVCADRFPLKYFASFEDGIHWNGGIHWLENFVYCKLDIVDRPILTTKSSPLNLNGKLFESRGCLLLVGMADATFKQFNIYDMDNRYYEWSLKYRINLDDIMMVYPKTWKLMHANCVSYSIPSIVLGEKEEDSFLVMELDGKLVQYNIATKTIRRLCHFSVNPSNSFPFIASFAGV